MMYQSYMKMILLWCCCCCWFIFSVYGTQWCRYAYHPTEKYPFSLNQCNHLKQNKPPPIGGTPRDEWFKAVCEDGIAYFNYYSDAGCSGAVQHSVNASDYNCNAYYDCRYRLMMNESSTNETCDNGGEFMYDFHLAKVEYQCLGGCIFDYHLQNLTRICYDNDNCEENSSGDSNNNNNKNNSISETVIIRGCAYFDLRDNFFHTTIVDDSEPILWRTTTTPDSLTLLNLAIQELNIRTSTVDIVLTYSGTPSNAWFGIGFGGQRMSGTYTLIYMPGPILEERDLGNHWEGTNLSSSLLFSNVVIENDETTLTVVRPVEVLDGSGYYSFSFDPAVSSNIEIPIIFAHGRDEALSYHAARGVGAITLQFKAPETIPSTTSISETTTQVSTSTASSTESTDSDSTSSTQSEIITTVAETSNRSKISNTAKLTLIIVFSILGAVLLAAIVFGYFWKKSSSSSMSRAPSQSGDHFVPAKSNTSDVTDAAEVAPLASKRKNENV